MYYFDGELCPKSKNENSNYKATTVHQIEPNFFDVYLSNS